jgi:hypothetical protein
MARKTFKSTRVARATLVLSCSLLALCCAQAAFAHGVRREATTTAPPVDATGYSVTVERCLTSTVQAERSVTFTAQMTATATTQRMAVRVELEQRLRGEPVYHPITAPGLGVWERSETGVQIYKYVKQVTNLDAPAAYRAVVRFRWLGDKGRVLKRAETRTERCVQPALQTQVTQTPPPVAS